MRTADFQYDLPGELIAQTPAPARDKARLLVLHRPAGGLEHRGVSALPDYLRAGDVLVFNDSRVIPARLHAVNAKTGGRFEVLLLEENAPNDWWAMMRPGKRARAGTELLFENQKGVVTAVQAAVVGQNAEGHRRLRFAGSGNILEFLDSLGELPLPPYIVRKERQSDEDRARYQTVFARPPGSVAAPTAGLHFTDALLAQIRARGVETCFVTLHVGVGTFAPVKADDLAGHVMHEERYDVSAATADTINRARAEGRRIVAVGTTTMRVLESIAAQTADGALRPGPGRTRIFIHPPYAFKIAGALLTNFHLPCSTLLMLVSAFADPGGLRGRDMVLAAYKQAVAERYRFFSYGDAMFID
jgi:S-adenosylmethionine:tRNA ribosyltransferase-isomerase